MKKLFIIIMLFITIGINAQVTTDSTCITDTNVEKLIDKYTDKISVAITSLANSLKQPAEYVYDVLIKQQLVISYTNSFIFIIFLVSFIIAIKTTNKTTEWEYPIGIVCLYIIAFTLFIFSLVELQATIQGFVNPEYGAMQDIINIIK
jgi:hypothetical protein